MQITRKYSLVSVDHEPSRSRTLFERALDALPDGVLLTDTSRHVVYANAAFAEHWNIPQGMIAARDEARMLQFVQDQLVDPAAFVREVERINPTSETSQDEILEWAAVEDIERESKGCWKANLESILIQLGLLRPDVRVSLTVVAEVIEVPFRCRTC